MLKEAQMKNKKPQRGRPRKVSDGMIHEAIMESKDVADAARMLGVSLGHIYSWWLRNGRVGPSPAKLIKQRRAKEREMQRRRQPKKIRLANAKMEQTL
jgi:transposase